MKIRTRLILVLSVLVALIALASLTAVTAFARLGGTVASAMRENVRSIDACSTMAEALALQDRGFLLLLGGQPGPGREAVRRGGEEFLTALGAARDNITMEGEAGKVDAISRAYNQYLAVTQRFRAVAPGAAGAAMTGLTAADYVVLAEPHLVEARDAIRSVSGLNHSGIEVSSKDASRSGWRRSAWVVSVGTLGIALAVFLGRRLYRSITVPLEAVSRGIAALGHGDLVRRVGHEGRDELGQIAAAVNATAERLAAAEAQREGRLRTYERMAAALLDALGPSGIVVDREGNVVLAGRGIRERLGDDPLGALRGGVRGLIEAGELDRRLEEVLRSRPSQIPPDPSAPSGRVTLRPVIGRGGSLLGAVVLVSDGPAVR